MKNLITALLIGTLLTSCSEYTNTPVVDNYVRTTWENKIPAYMFKRFDHQVRPDTEKGYIRFTHDSIIVNTETEKLAVRTIDFQTNVGKDEKGNDCWLVVELPENRKYYFSTDSTLVWFKVVTGLTEWKNVGVYEVKKEVEPVNEM